MYNSKLFFNFQPIIIDNFFTEQEIESIYKTRFEIAPNEKRIDKTSYMFSDPNCGYITCFYPLEETIRKKIVSQIAENVPLKIKEQGNHIPRYTLDSGSKPSLWPHYDSGLLHPSFTLSIQLKHTIPWDLYVEGKSFTLKYNQAVLFSGSHQMHWRPRITFDKTDYYDIIVCQVHEDIENPPMLDSSHKEIMQAKADFYIDKFFNS
jgi:hypothetical protein